MIDHNTVEISEKSQSSRESERERDERSQSNIDRCEITRQ